MFIIDFILEGVGYTTARLLLPILSRGSIRVQTVSSDETGFNWFGFKRLEGGCLICQGPMAGWIGLIPWTLMFIAILTVV